MWFFNKKEAVKSTATNVKKRPKPVILAILDGWGVSQPYSGNAISQANTSCVKDLISRYPATTLRTSGEAVGLPWGEAGNSEVGHLNLGLGRIVYQELPRINRSITDNSFFSNPVLLKAVEHVRQNSSKLHLMGLLSNGGVHSSIDHLLALLSLAKEQKIDRVFIHIFLDGRDTQFNAGINFIQEVERNLEGYGFGSIASISGRFYALDRDNHWERVSKAYFAITRGEGNLSDDPKKALEESYAKKIYDEEFVPTVIVKDGKPLGLVENNDSLIFFNFRADRAREITKAFVLPSIPKFERGPYINNLMFVTFTEYEKGLPVEVAFPPDIITSTLGDVISREGLKQLRIAETEKYAHVTYFFNGGREDKSLNEDAIIVPSPRVDSYAEKPEMSAYEVTDKILKAVQDDTYDFILVNFANADMVGHTGNLEAGIKAVEAVDKCVEKLYKAVIKNDGMLIITADHGNAEGMFNMQSGTIDKEHSTNPVPLIIAGNGFEGKRIGSQDALQGDLSLVQPQGILADVAPTILKIMDLPIPPEMTGRPLI